MKAILLDGSQADDNTGDRVRIVMQSELQRRGWEVETFLLRDYKIGNCAGDFYCWVREPGICNIADDNRKIAEALVHSDLMVYLTPVTFGGYSSALKRMVDHQIQNVLPFFTRVGGEIHHQKRYKHYPDFLAVGWLDTPDPQAEAIFRHLVGRNTRNFYSKTSISALAYGNQSESEMRQAAGGWLDDLSRGRSSRPVELPVIQNVVPTRTPIQRALVLVGSPRTRKSTSNSLGSYLAEKMEAQGLQVETRYIYTTLRSKERWSEMLQAVEAADLVLLAFPLYVDTLPAPVIEALERIAAYRSSHEHRGMQRFAVLVNCGFPEAGHNDNAQAVCARFARQAGFAWAGGLSLGGGQGLVSGMPLAEVDGRGNYIRKSLEMAAPALAQGESIPPAAVELMAKPAIPTWLYLLLSSFGIKQQARQYGTQKELRHRPYLAKQ